MQKVFVWLIFCFFFIANAAFANTANDVYGPTTTNDRLYRIAIEVRPTDEVSVEQVMLALLSTNKKAFNCYNVNALRSGYILKIPNLDRIGKVSESQAWREVNRQNLAWCKNKSVNKVSKKRAKITKITKKVTGVAKVAVLPRTKTEATLLPQLPSQPQLQQRSQLQQRPQPSSIPSEELAPLKNQIDETNSQLQSIKHDLNERVSTLEANHAALAALVSGYGQQINRTETQLTEINKKIGMQSGYFGNAIIKVGQFLNYWQARFGRVVFLIVLSVLVLIFFIAIWLIIPRRKKPVAASIAYLKPKIEDEEPPEPEEFNLIESEAGTAAKLNLASAYIDMGKKPDAEKLLQDVLKVGNQTEQAEAKELLKKMRS